MNLDETLEAGFAEMQKYGEGTTLGELIRIKIREGEQWAADAWAADRWVRGDLSPRIGEHVVWAALLMAAAQHHPDWIFTPGVVGQDKAVRPRKRATIRTRKAVVAWFVLNYPDLAFAIEERSWNVAAI